MDQSDSDADQHLAVAQNFSLRPHPPSSGAPSPLRSQESSPSCSPEKPCPRGQRTDLEKIFSSLSLLSDFSTRSAPSRLEGCTIFEDDITSISEDNKEGGTYPCNEKKCKTCSHIMITDRIRIPRTQKDYMIPRTFTCSTSNIVYLILCTKCPINCLYVGETEQRLRERMRFHRHTIKEKKTHLTVAKHFCSSGHKEKDMKVLILKGDFKSDKNRKAWENRFIAVFDTIDNGLNLS